MKTLLVCTLFVLLVGSALQAQESHGLARYGDLAYAAQFPHFRYAKPDASRRGEIVIAVPSGDFDSFHPILAGLRPAGLSSVYESLAVQAQDEPETYYGLIARSFLLSQDRGTLKVMLRPEAAFSDGSPVTSTEVIHSFELQKSSAYPPNREAFKKVTATATGRHEVTIALDPADRDLAFLVATVPIVSLTGRVKIGNTTMPLGSGPYTISKTDPHRFVEYQRRENYWGRSLNVNIGRYNLEKITYAYPALLYTMSLDVDCVPNTDRPGAWEAAFFSERKHVKRIALPQRGTLQTGLLLNTGSPALADVRVRRALDLVLNFDLVRIALRQPEAHRTASFFVNPAYRAVGSPDRLELEFLSPFRAQLDPAIFGPVYDAPDVASSSRERLTRAVALLQEAGWSLRNEKMINADGKQLILTLLIPDKIDRIDRVFDVLKRDLVLLGVLPEIVTAQGLEFERLRREAKFDVTFGGIHTSPEHIRSSLGSMQTTDRMNWAGVNSPVVDNLIGRMFTAASSVQHFAAAKALDRVLRASHYWISGWERSFHLGCVDRFGWMPDRTQTALDFPHSWWEATSRQDKAAK